MGTRLRFGDAVVDAEAGKVIIPVEDVPGGITPDIPETDDQIFDKMKADRTFGLVRGGDAAIRSLVPGVREMCAAQGWSIDQGIETIGLMMHAKIIGGSVAATHYRA